MVIICGFSVDCRRTGSGISVDSIGANLGPTVDNYDSSDTDSETRAEAKVITHKKVSSRSWPGCHIMLFMGVECQLDSLANLIMHVVFI